MPSSFDSQIFSIQKPRDEMITQGLLRIEERSGEADKTKSSLTVSAECNYFVLITKTLSRKGRKRMELKEEKLAQRECSANARPKCICLKGQMEDFIYLYLYRMCVQAIALSFFHARCYTRFCAWRQRSFL